MDGIQHSGHCVHANQAKDLYAHSNLELYYNSIIFHLEIIFFLKKLIIFNINLSKIIWKYRKIFWNKKSICFQKHTFKI
jgi:hypothetical protein